VSSKRLSLTLEQDVQLQVIAHRKGLISVILIIRSTLQATVLGLSGRLRVDSLIIMGSIRFIIDMAVWYKKKHRTMCSEKIQKKKALFDGVLFLTARILHFRSVCVCLLFGKVLGKENVRSSLRKAKSKKRFRFSLVSLLHFCDFCVFSPLPTPTFLSRHALRFEIGTRTTANDDNSTSENLMVHLKTHRH
jgi:hypothetical protein